MDKIDIFIQESLKRGFSLKEVESKLLEVGWPPENVHNAITRANNQDQENPKVVFRKKQEPGKIFAKPQFTEKTILQTLLIFLGASIILSLTFAIFTYEWEIVNYTITDPVTGEQLRGYCEDPSCSEVKEAAAEAVKDNLTLDILMAMLAALIATMAYLFIVNKKAVIWTLNSIFFLLVIVMAVVWFAFI
tara:strand:- start:2649 stop:3218 length:570 start_codon:yes stop_codon:yes gene_type:complete